MAQLETTSFEILDLPAVKTNIPLFANELLQNVKDIRIAEANAPGLDEYYMPVSFAGQPVRIQTPIVDALFGVQKYRNPGKDQVKYSIHLSLRKTYKENQEFRDLLEAIDITVATRIPLPPEKFFSAIRHNKADATLPPVLRVKVPNSDNYLLIEAYHKGKAILEPTGEELHSILTTTQKVRCIIEVNPVWVTKNLFGISYKLLQIQTVNITGPQFR